jgi:hypothetical protein
LFEAPILKLKARFPYHGARETAGVMMTPQER